MFYHPIAAFGTPVMLAGISGFANGEPPPQPFHYQEHGSTLFKDLNQKHRVDGPRISLNMPTLSILKYSIASQKDSRHG
jgi:hypothetical protein